MTVELELSSQTESVFRKIINMRGYTEQEALNRLVEILVEKGGFGPLEDAPVPEVVPVASEEEAMEFIAELYSGYAPHSEGDCE